MDVSVGITFSDADETAFETLATPAQRQTFLIAKLAATQAQNLESVLAGGTSILALLQPADQQALGGLIAAVKAMPIGT